ncbi:ABC transporter substrate-binding protein [Thiomicrorhabdus indica]|uniref:ABC transporter substrate-binding protein n=1 Tax=Thiomicrorhabdus indica TaxID=2267253 RepID=UPI002AA78340|nr:ABC transporter substrate-binding protein [Thiomicrorhabdus indica]
MKRFPPLLTVSSGRRFLARFIYAIGLIWLSLAITAQASQSSHLKPVKLSLKWTHQFQFAGYYMAKEKGYYQDAGLEVTFLEADPASDPIKRVLDGEAQFGVGTSDLILNAAKGDPIVVLGVIMQHSPLGLVATDPDIKTVSDLRGKKLMIEENSAELFAFLNANDLKRDDYILHRHHLRLEDLVEKKVDAISIYKTTELSDLNEKNMPYRAFYPIDSGIDFYGDNLFTTQDMVEHHLKTVEDFREASFRGWEYAMKHPEETIRHLLKNYVTNRTYEQLQFEAQQMQGLMQPDRIYPGKMTRNHWETIAQNYVDLGMIDEPPDMDQFLYLPELKFDEIYQQLNLSLIALVILLLLMAGLGLLLRYMSQQKKQYRTLFQKAPLAILVLDKHHRIVHWNPQAEHTFGWQKAEVMGLSIFDFLVANTDVHGVKKTLSNVHLKGERRQLINQNITKDGQCITCSWTNSVFGDPKFQQIICMAIDLSELSELSEEGSRSTPGEATDSSIDNPVSPGLAKSPSLPANDASADSLGTEDIPAEAAQTSAQQSFNEAEQLAIIMKLSLFLWQEDTGKNKIQLAEDSKLWRVTLDGGSAKTRTLDKYLHADTIPNNPRWRNVIDTARFVQAQRSQNHLELQQLVDAFVQHKQPKI